MKFSHKAAGAALGVLLLGGLSVSGQTQTPPSDMAALLAEVKALRADLGQAAGASIRMQVLVARVSLQEQRITSAGRQLNELEGQLTSARQDNADLADQLKRFDQIVEITRSKGGDPAGFEEQRDAVKRRLAETVVSEQQLQLRVVEMQNVLAQEQGRWADFNSRLDELERSLPVGR